MTIRRATLKKIAEFLIDVAKYVLTVAIVMSFLGELGEMRFWYYGVGVFFVVVCLVYGLFIINKLDKDEDKIKK